MYTMARENTLQEYMAPEMIRSRLENVILKIRVLGYEDVDDFLALLMDSPSSESVGLSNQVLKDIGVLNPSTMELTGLEWNLGSFSWTHN